MRSQKRSSFCLYQLAPPHLAALLALFAGRAQWMWGAAALFGLAVIGRILGVALDGAPEGVVQPIVIELVLVALSVFGAKTPGRGCPHRPTGRNGRAVVT